MYLRKSFGQYLPILLVYGLVIASFIDYIFNYCWSLISEGHIVQSIIYLIIYNVLLVFFVYSYNMVTFTDPGCPTKDVINVLSKDELASYYTTLEEMPELKKMNESTSTNSSQQSTGALLKNEEKLKNSDSLIINDKFDENNNNYSIDIPLTEIPSSSNANEQNGTEILINPLNSSSPRKEQTVTFLNDKPNVENTIFNRSVNKKDQISIDIDNDRIIERKIEKFNKNNNSNESIEEETLSNNNRRNIENEEEMNSLVCKKCLGFKPERTHHCSVCNRCVLKMDHHCPWLSNCVGFYNYKYFILFLFYGSFYILFQFLTVFISFVIDFPFSDRLFDDFIFFPDHKKLWVIHIFLSFVLGVSVSIFCVTHVYQNLLGNATTLELFDKQRKIRRYRFNIIRDNGKREIDKMKDEVNELEEFINNSPSDPNIEEKRKELKKKKDKLNARIKEYNSPRNRSPFFVSDSPRNIPKSILHNPYDIGKLDNFYQVFGKDPKRWFIPVPSSIGDGYHYPKHEFQG